MPQTYRDDVAPHPVKQHPDTDIVLDKINSGKLWVVNSRRRNGIVVYKKFHAEFAGPGAAVGGALDTHCDRITALGNLSLVEPNPTKISKKPFAFGCSGCGSRKTSRINRFPWNALK